MRSPSACPRSASRRPFPAEPIGRVLASGSIITQKGFDLLAAAVDVAAVQWPLTILGDGPHRPALEARLRSSPAGRVRLAGWQDDPISWLEHARVVCLPSRWETFPFAAIEAQLAARPVVAFAVDGIPEIVEHGVSGLLVEPGDVHGLARALDRLTSSHAEAVQMGAAGRRRALASFALATMLDRVEEVYRRVVRG